MNITEIRRNNINIGRLASNSTNKLKGLKTFIKRRSNNNNLLTNDIIDSLIKSNYYTHIYNIFIPYIHDNDVDLTNIDLNELHINGLLPKDYDLLLMFDFIQPKELYTLYEGDYYAKNK